MTTGIICSHGRLSCDAQLLGTLLKGAIVIKLWPRPKIPYSSLLFDELVQQYSEWRFMSVVKEIGIATRVDLRTERQYTAS